MGFEEFQPIIGEPKPEWAKKSGSAPLRRFLMHVFAPDYYHLKIHVTDFHSHTFEAVKSVPQLEDMRDSVGIGGSWSEFVDYLIASIKSEDVKLVLEKHKDQDGATCAKLVAQKAKGLPLVSISLTKLASSAANDAMADTSFGLFKAFKCMQNLVVQAQEQSVQLTKMMSEEKSESIRTQMEKKRKSSEKSDVSAQTPANVPQESPDKRGARDPASTKVTNRVVPAYRRAKTRGARLQDAEDKDA